MVLLYITLIVIGSYGFDEPPTSFALFNDISFVTFVIEDVPPEEELVVETATGTNTALFQSSDFVPFFLTLYI